MTVHMKNLATKTIVVLILGSFLLASCSRKSGCPSNGNNMGAERILNGEKSKAKKFKA
jgi:uncharacterized lipoprotein YajG